MKRWYIRLFVALFLMAGVASAIAGQVDAEEKSMSEVTLTAQQQEELAKIYQDIFEKKKEVIAKYVEYGVFTEEKGNKVISKFEEHHQKLAESGFIPNWHKCKKQKHS